MGPNVSAIIGLIIVNFGPFYKLKFALLYLAYIYVQNVKMN